MLSVELCRSCAERSSYLVAQRTIYSIVPQHAIRSPTALRHFASFCFARAERPGPQGKACPTESNWPEPSSRSDLQLIKTLRLAMNPQPTTLAAKKARPRLRSRNPKFLAYVFTRLMCLMMGDGMGACAAFAKEYIYLNA